MKSSTANVSLVPVQTIQKLTVARDKVGRVKTHLDNLDNEFTSRLAENVSAKTTVEPDTLSDQ